MSRFLAVVAVILALVVGAGLLQAWAEDDPIMPDEQADTPTTDDPNADDDANELITGVALVLFVVVAGVVALRFLLGVVRVPGRLFRRRGHFDPDDDDEVVVADEPVDSDDDDDRGIAATFVDLTRTEESP